MFCFYFYVYRGTGGLLAVISPWVVGIVLRYPLQYIFHFDHHFFLGDRLWSNGLAMFLGGLLTAAVLYRQRSSGEAGDAVAGATETAAGTHEYAPAATGAAVLEIAAAGQEESPTVGDTASEEEPLENGDEAVKGSSSNTSSVQPLETDAIDNDDLNTTSTTSATRLGTIVQYWLHQYPTHPHHVCFLSTDRIAIVLMMLGILCMILDLINFLLKPLGGIMNVISWAFVLGIVYCMYRMVCGPVPAHYNVQEVSSEEAEAPEAHSVETMSEEGATEGDVKVAKAADTGLDGMAVIDGALQTHSTTYYE